MAFFNYLSSSTKTPKQQGQEKNQALVKIDFRFLISHFSLLQIGGKVK